MGFKEDLPEFASLEERIRYAKAERSVYIGYMIGEALLAMRGFIKRSIAAASNVRPEANATPMFKRFAPHR